MAYVLWCNKMCFNTVCFVALLSYFIYQDSNTARHTFHCMYYNSKIQCKPPQLNMISVAGVWFFIFFFSKKKLFTSICMSLRWFKVINRSICYIITKAFAISPQLPKTVCPEYTWGISGSGPCSKICAQQIYNTIDVDIRTRTAWNNACQKIRTRLGQIEWKKDGSSI